MNQFRKIILTLAVTMGATASAMNSSELIELDLEELREAASHERLYIRAPQIRFGGYATSVFNTCINGSQLQTVSTVAVCTKWGPGHEGKCLEEKFVHKTRPLNYTKVSHCLKRLGREDRCVKRGTKVEYFRLPTTVEITVSKYTKARLSGNDSTGDFTKYLFTKNYTIKACE